MGDPMKQSVETPGQGDQTQNGLTKHQKDIIDYAMVAAVAANKAQTEELFARTKFAVREEIHAKFEQFTKVTTGRKVIMAVGAVLAFGAGFLVKGMLIPKLEAETNHVRD